MTAPKNNQDNNDNLSNIKEALSNTETLLQQAARSSGKHADELREKAASLLSHARERAANLQDKITAKGRYAIDATDDYVHEKPWTSIGVGVAVGFLIGLLVGRR